MLTAPIRLSKMPMCCLVGCSDQPRRQYSPTQSTQSPYMIEVQQITKRYGQHTALDRISFSVAKGEVLAFLGPNGAGKTTTMRILTCFMPATEGSARVAGFDCADQQMEVKRRIGYLPETPPVYQELTVTEYLQFVGRLRSLGGKILASSMQREIERLGLGTVQHRLIGNLSRGYRQRVGLAQALLHDPQILILDEPTVGLDPKQIIEIRELIKNLAGSHSVILSTHILPEATAVCQRVVIISGGRIVAEDTPEQLSARLRQSEKISLTLKSPAADTDSRLKAVQGVQNVFTSDASLYRGGGCVKCWLALKPNLSSACPSLSDGRVTSSCLPDQTLR